jgi:DNA-binding CsgD family transcriptional regulator
MRSASNRLRPATKSVAAERADDHQLLSGVVGDIYDAALDDALWPTALERSALFVGGVGASLFARDTAAIAGVVYHNFGIAPYYQKLYFDKFSGLDPLTMPHLSAEHEQPLATSDLMSYEEFSETRFYREWIRPQSLVDFVGVVLERSASTITVFGVFRHERDGLVDESVRRRMTLLAPHIRRAILIRRIVDAKDAKAVTFADTFDGLTSGLYIVDETGRILHANRAGKFMLTARSPVRMAGGKLVASEPQSAQALRNVIAAANIGGASPSDGLALPLTGECGERYVAHILPLASRGSHDVSRPAIAAVFVRRVTLPLPSPPGVIGRAFRLTAAELRVLFAIVEIGGVPEVAAALGVAETTIKTHLGHLFEKTGATRQADLVKLVAGYASPIGVQPT